MSESNNEVFGRFYSKWLQNLSRHWEHLGLRTKGAVVIAIPVLCGMVGFISVLAIQRSAAETEESLRRALKVRYRIGALAAELREIETGSRGYVSLHQSDYLDGYNDAIEGLPEIIRLLDDEIRGPDQAARLKAFKLLLRPKLQTIAELVEAARISGKSNPGEASEQFLDYSIPLLEPAQAILRQMEDAEFNLLNWHLDRLNKIESSGISITLGSIAFGLLGGLIAMRLFISGIARKIERLQDNARRLAAEMPLLPVQTGEEELAQLDRELHRSSELLEERNCALRLDAKRIAGSYADLERAEAVLRDSNQKLETALRTNDLVLKHSLDVICTVDASGCFVTVSPACLLLWGYETEELVGRPYIDFVCKEDREKTIQIAQSIMAGTPVHDFENRYCRKDGNIVPIVWSAVWSAEEKSMFSVARDATERMRAHEAAEAIRLASEQANRAKSEFLSRMSHELRTPLNAIIGFGQLLESEKLGEEDADSVDQILKAGRHLLELINEVLDISRLESGRLRISQEPVCIGDVIDECIQLVGPLARQRGITISDCEEQSIYHVLADRQRLKQVLLNLLSNAVKYNRQAGSITIALELRAGEMLRVKVTDSGSGLSPEELRRLFTPFERLHAEQSHIEGSGLGLVLSKRLVELMKGQIGAESESGNGSIFWIEFPLVADPMLGIDAGMEGTSVGRRPRMMEISQPDPLEPSVSILYIEDNLSNLSLIQRILTRRPHVRLIAAMQGSLGLELAREHSPHLILLDVNLPDMPGLEVLRRLREGDATWEIPVVVVSADATPGTITELKAAGAKSYLTKPIDVPEFLNLIDEMLGAIK